MDDLLRMSDPVSNISGVGDKIASELEKLGVNSVKDLIEYLPFRLEDRTNEQLIKNLRIGEPSVIKATIINVSTRRSKTGRLIVQAKVYDDSSTINILWFNQRFILKLLKEGEIITVYGEKRLSKPLGNPFFATAIINNAEVLPIYRRTKNISQYQLRKIIKQALASVETNKRIELLKKCHLFPSEQLLQRCWKLISYEQIYIYARKVYEQQSKRKEIKRPPIEILGDKLKDFVFKLNVQPTASQRKNAWEILQDCSNSFPMRRLLYGEVGSGKTLVALIVAANYIFNNKKVAVLAPTVALSEQLYNEFSKVFEGLTAQITGKNKTYSDKAKIIVGTHALLNRHDLFNEIDLIITDEQQKFGVEDREKIINANEKADLLMMSATPIPRTLAHTLFGGIDISYLLEKPKFQKPIISKIVLQQNKEGMYKEIDEKVANGEQGYVICPLITNSDTGELFSINEKKSVLDVYEYIKKRFTNANVGFIHGKLSEKEKVNIFNDFINNKIQILVGTTVLEVGLNNPNASWMVIENAQMFGLSTLHQLRGRIGRGNIESTCYFISNETDNMRLSAILNAQNGLELATLDMQQRGPGDLLGIEQSGKLALKKSVWNNIHFITKVFGDAKDGVISDDLAEV